MLQNILFISLRSSALPSSQNSFPKCLKPAPAQRWECCDVKPCPTCTLLLYPARLALVRPCWQLFWWLSSLDLWQSSSVRLTLIGCSAQWIRTWEAHRACWNIHYVHQFIVVSPNFSSLGIYLWEWSKTERKMFLFHDDGLYLRKSRSFWFPFLNDETIATRWCDQLFIPMQLLNLRAS